MKVLSDHYSRPHHIKGTHGPNVVRVVQHKNLSLSKDCLVVFVGIFTDYKWLVYILWSYYGDV